MPQQRKTGVERVTFPSRGEAHDLVGMWHHGSRDAAVILCHGMESSKDGNKSVRLARAFADEGVNALRFDFSYVGESSLESGLDLEDLTITGEVHDLAGAWVFARQRISGPIGIVGSSLGGTVALLFAAQEPEVAAVATIAAVAVPARWAHEFSRAERERWRRTGYHDWQGMRLKAAFLEDLERTNVVAQIPRILCPLLITHGTFDEVVPCADAHLIADNAQCGKTVRLYDGGDHRFSDPLLLESLLEGIVEWMMPRLQRIPLRLPRNGA